MKKWIPAPVRRIVGPWVRNGRSSLARAKIRSKKIALPEPGTVALSYAGMLPVKGEVAHGGRVKLGLLGKIYPEQAAQFNILYLVSSALPPYAEDWVYACKKAGVKVVWNQNGVGYPAWAGADYEKVNAPMKRLIHSADWVVYQSEFCKTGADKYLGKFAGPHSIVYNSVDTDTFSPAAPVVPQSPVTLLVMGSHHHPYRVIKALEALALLSERNVDARLVIAGRLAWPGADDEISLTVNKLKLSGRVAMSGPYLQDDAPTLYRCSHILLHLQYNDACPTVPIEAMACGVPVVGSSSGGVPELLGGSGGVAVEVPQSWENTFPPEPETIARAVETIMAAWGEWSRGARERAVKYFDKTHWLKEHERIFRQVLDS